MTVQHAPVRSSAFASVVEFLALHRAAPDRSALSRFFGVDPLARLASSSYAGAEAEIAVADALDTLGAEWTVLTDLILGIGGQPVAYTLIGPAGVFVLEVHNHSSADVWVGERSLVVDGAPGVHIIEAEQDADSVARRLADVTGLQVVVTPCLVIANAAELTVRERHRRVEILLPSAVGSFFAELPRLLSPAIVDRYHEAGLDPSTWRTDAGEGVSPLFCARERAEFANIQRSISASYRRRLLWAVAGASVTAALLMTTTGGLAARAFGILP